MRLAGRTALITGAALPSGDALAWAVAAGLTGSLAIALFYAFGTAVGGIAGPIVFGALIETGERSALLWGYLLAGGLMLGAAVVAALLAVDAERRSLEDVAPPLSSA